MNRRVVAIVTAILLPVLAARQGAAQGHGEDVPRNLRRPFTRAMFTDGNTGYVYDVIGQTVIIATADGGATWRMVKDVPVVQSPKASTAIFFLNGSTFWVLSEDGALSRTTDGGRTFVDRPARVLDPSGRPIDLFCGGLFFRNLSDGWLACNRAVLHTVDGGVSWQQLKLPSGVEAIDNIWFFDDRDGVAVGYGVVRTADGGQTWQAVSGAPERLGELSCTRDEFCVAGAGMYGPLFASSDHGRTWSDLKVPLKPDQQDELLGFQAVSAKLVLVVGTDNGFTMTDIRTTGAAGTSPPSDTGRGLILKWDGTTWTRITHDQPQDFAGVFFVDADNGWFPDFENTIYKTTDGGQTVTFVPDYFRQTAALTPSPTRFMLDPTPTP